MNECLNCNKGCKRKFCSSSCANKYNGRQKVLKNIAAGSSEAQVCSECKLPKSGEKFSYVDKHDTSKGRRLICKNCSANIRMREKHARTWKYDAAQILLSNAKQRAKNSNLEFTITKSDIVIPDKCPVLGIPLKREKKERWYSAPSIDRIDNSKGYTPDNIIIVSRRVNILKRDATLDELQKISSFYSTMKEKF